jgi:hypothetical protein
LIEQVGLHFETVFLKTFLMVMNATATQFILRRLIVWELDLVLTKLSPARHRPALAKLNGRSRMYFDIWALQNS